MKKAFKIPLIILFVILILVFAAVTAIDIFADSALKIGIETAATRTLNVGVSIEDVELSILGGKIRIDNLSINNPPGYQYEKLLELEKAKIEVEIKSLLSDVVNIKDINIDGVNVVLEQRGIHSNNLQDIISSIGAKKKQAPKAAGEKPHSEKPHKEEAKRAGKKLHIDNLEISNITVKVKLLPIPGKADTITLKLSPIKMTDLGGDDKLDMAGLSDKILRVIAEGVAKEGGEVLPSDIIETVRLTLEETLKLGEAASKDGEKFIESGKDVIEAWEDIGKEIAEILKESLEPEKNDK